MVLKARRRTPCERERLMSKRFDGSLAYRLGARIAAGPNNCHIWTGGTNDDGYGIMGIKRTSTRAHIVAYELMHGPVPAGLQIDHTCRNRRCVNALHLEAVMSRVNTLRGNGPAGKNARRSLCKNGHPFDVVNKYGKRGCRRCINATHAAYKDKHRARFNANARRTYAARVARAALPAPEVKP